MRTAKRTGDAQLDQLTDDIRQFVAERDWEQFHSPKNLAMALSVEAAELVEIFQWMPQAQSSNLSAADLEHARHEIADILIYLLRIADRLDINVIAAVKEKIRVNQKKYPANLVRGKANKSTDYKP